MACEKNADLLPQKCKILNKDTIMPLQISNNKSLEDYNSEIQKLEYFSVSLAGRRVTIGKKTMSLNSIIKKRSGY